MKDFEKVIDFSNLYRAYKKSKSGKHFRQSSGKFQIRCLDGINRIQKSLIEHTYTPSPYFEKYVYEPKKRLIKIAPFQDCVIQHSLCDNVLMPRLEQEFIENNFAGRIGKGTLYGINTLKSHMQSFYELFGDNGYILKADITKFYYSIDHEILKSMLEQFFDDEDILWLCKKIIDSTDNPGLPLGNQSSQVFALLYLNQLDHIVTNTLGVKYYGRYADDFYLIHEDKQFLTHCLAVITDHISTLNLSLNGKTQIVPFKQGLKFLGFHTYIKDGKVICKISNQKKRNAYRKYTKMAKRVAEGKMELSKFNDCFTAFKAHAAFGDCEDLIANMDRKIDELLKGEILPCV